jgi:type I restriction enzyme S subunit
MRQQGLHPLYWAGEKYCPPTDWRIRPIRDYATVVKGKMPCELFKEPLEGSLPYLLIDGLDNGETLYTNEIQLPITEETDTVVVADGSRSGLAIRGMRGVLGSTLLAYRAKDGIDSDYLFYVLESLYPFNNTATIGGAIPHLDKRLLAMLALATPGFEEQRRIAAALKLADDAIQKARAELDATRALKRSLLNELLEKGLPGRHSSFIETKRMSYPESWTLTKLKKCGTWSAGGTPDRENVGYYEGSIPWVKSGEVNYSVIVETEEHLSEDGAKQTTCGVLPVGTLLIAMYGAGVTRGRVALLGIQASTNQAVATFNGHEGVENEFVYYWFERNYERVRAWAAGSNQDNLSGYLLKNLQIALPNHDEQIEIVKVLKAADSAICAIQDRVATLLELKRSLLQNLLTGKIRIPEGAIHA